MKKLIIKTAILLSLLTQTLFADAPVVITSPAAWTTLRSDSVVVTAQVDAGRLPRNTVDFRVVRKSGNRSATLFTKTVPADDLGAEVFLGSLRNADIPTGGNDFISIEWSVAGSEHRGTVEPLGAMRVDGAVSEDNKWQPSQPPIIAAKIDDGADVAAIETALANAANFSVANMNVNAGWNSDALFLRIVPPTGNTLSGITSVDFAIDPKNAKLAFLGWADRFVTYTSETDSVTATHYGTRSVDGNAITRNSRSWASDRAIEMHRVEESGARIISIRWSEIGVQPFEGRTVGFSAFVNSRRGHANYPVSNNVRRELPGSWGNLRLE